MIDIKRIVVPTDFSPCAQHAVRYAAEFARRFGAELTLVHAIEAPMNLSPQTLVRLDPSDAPLPIMDYVRQAAERRMDAALAELTLADVRARTVIAVGDTRDVVLEHAASDAADLIVMGTHGRTGLRHVLLGSIAEEVLRRAKVPVLTIRYTEPPRPDTSAQS